MNHCVPDFHEMEDDDSIPTPSSFSRPKKPATAEEEIMELLWQNGPVVVHSQNQRPSKRSAFGGGDVVSQAERETRSSADEQQHLFMQEDEMASWLQYPLDDSSFDRDLYADLLYSAPPPPPPTHITSNAQPKVVAEIRPPPLPPANTKPDNPPRVHNFVHFSRLPIRPRIEPMPSIRPGRESTVVESNDTPLVGPDSRVSQMVADSNRPEVNAESGTATAGGTSAAAGTCEITVTSSPGGSRTSFTARGDTPQPQPKPPPAVEDRKRKARETDDTECHSENIEFEATEARKPGCGSSSTKRSRAAEVHNLSERRRRDRINEKMKALQELIPRCNKSDKASMLDEAIEYLKSLQLQVQMMSMGCGMVPMMYPGIQQYMPAMGLGMGMGMGMPGMGMGMDMGMNRPPVPYPSVLQGPAMPNAAAAAHMGPRFPMPAFRMPPVPVADPSRIQASNQTDPVSNSVASQNQNQARIPNFVDRYQQFVGFHHTQLPYSQNQAVVQPGASKLSSSKDVSNPDSQQSG